MKILVIGAGGMIGRKLVEHLLAKGTLRGEVISHLTVYDIFEPEYSSSDIDITSLSGDFGIVSQLNRTDKPRRCLACVYLPNRKLRRSFPMDKKLLRYPMGRSEFGV